MNDIEINKHRRRGDSVSSMYKRRIARGVIIVVTATSGIAAERALGVADKIVGTEWRAQIDRERAELIPQFRDLQREVNSLKYEVSANKNIGEVQRNEIINRLDRLEGRLERWFEKASK